MSEEWESLILAVPKKWGALRDSLCLNTRPTALKEKNKPLSSDKVSLVDRYQGYYLCSTGQTLLLEQVWAGCSGPLTRLTYIIINCSHNSTIQRSSDGRGASYLTRFIETRHLNNRGETGISWQYHDIVSCAKFQNLHVLDICIIC